MVGPCVRSATKRYTSEGMHPEHNDAAEDCIPMALESSVGYGPWTHVDGFSAHLIDWIKEYEAL